MWIELLMRFYTIQFIVVYGAFCPTQHPVFLVKHLLMHALVGAIVIFAIGLVRNVMRIPLSHENPALMLCHGAYICKWTCS